MVLSRDRTKLAVTPAVARATASSLREPMVWPMPDGNL